MAKRAPGGVFGEIDAMLARFEEEKKRFRATMKERLGTSRVLRVRNGLYACRYSKEWYHAPSVDALLEKVAPSAPQPEAPTGE